MQITRKSLVQYMSLLVALISLQGCWQSFNPLITEGNVMLDSKLLGNWQSKDKKYTLTIKKSEKAYRENKGFDLIISEGDAKKWKFWISTTKINDVWLLEAIPWPAKQTMDPIEIGVNYFYTTFEYEVSDDLLSIFQLPKLTSTEKAVKTISRKDIDVTSPLPLIISDAEETLTYLKSKLKTGSQTPRKTLFEFQKKDKKLN